MESYIVSARKYRPATFEDVVGQDAITSTLQRAIASNHLAQALLFCGPRGVGKTTCARILAKAINLDGATNPDEDFAFNIFELDAASNNSVDDIRNLIDQVRFAPQQGKFKVYIIDEVHMLSGAAFNAFLKTLEEPPAHAIFILATTEKHKIIPTILSRCQIFDFKRIMVADMVAHLGRIAEREGVTAEEEALHVIAEKADGALRDALSIFDRIVTFAGNTISYKDAVENLNILDHDYYFRATDLLMQGDIPGAMLLFNEVLESGFNGHEFINGLAGHFRNLLMCQDEATVKLLEVTDRVGQRYRAQARNVSPLNVLKSLRFMNECDSQYRASKNQRLLVELCLMKICALHRAPSDTAAEAPAEKKNLKPEQPVAGDPVPAAAPTVAVPAAAVPAVTPPVALTTAFDIDPIDSHAVETISQPKAPAPAPTPVPAGPAVIPITTRKAQRPGAVRISLAEEQDESPADPAELPQDSFTEEEMQRLYIERAQVLFKDRPLVLSSLTKRTPRLVSAHVIEVALDSDHELSVVNASKGPLLEALRKGLNNYTLQMETPVEAVITEKRAYLPREKYDKMLALNPHLEDLRTRFDLELE